MLSILWFHLSLITSKAIVTSADQSQMIVGSGRLQPCCLTLRLLFKGSNHGQVLTWLTHWLNCQNYHNLSESWSQIWAVALLILRGSFKILTNVYQGIILAAKIRIFRYLLRTFNQISSTTNKTVRQIKFIPKDIQHNSCLTQIMFDHWLNAVFLLFQIPLGYYFPPFEYNIFCLQLTPSDRILRITGYYRTISRVLRTGSLPLNKQQRSWISYITHSAIAILKQIVYASTHSRHREAGNELEGLICLEMYHLSQDYPEKSWRILFQICVDVIPWKSLNQSAIQSRERLPTALFINLQQAEMFLFGNRVIRDMSDWSRIAKAVDYTGIAQSYKLLHCPLLREKLFISIFVVNDKRIFGVQVVFEKYSQCSFYRQNGVYKETHSQDRLIQNGMIALKFSDGARMQVWRQAQRSAINQARRVFTMDQVLIQFACIVFNRMIRPFDISRIISPPKYHEWSLTTETNFHQHIYLQVVCIFQTTIPHLSLQLSGKNQITFSLVFQERMVMEAVRMVQFLDLVVFYLLFLHIKVYGEVPEYTYAVKSLNLCLVYSFPSLPSRTLSNYSVNFGKILINSWSIQNQGHFSMN